MESLDKTLSDTDDNTFSFESDFIDALFTDDRKPTTMLDSVDYWFGSLYLKSVIAQKLIHQISPQATFPELDTKLCSELQRFPYAVKYRELWQEGIDTDFDIDPIDEISCNVRYLKVVGSVMRSGDDDQQNILLRTFREHGVNGVTDVDVDSDDSVNTPRLRAEAQTRSPPTVANHVFTSILWEHATKRGWQIQHSVTRVLDDARAFKCEMNVNGGSFIGRGQNQNAAKHAASKKACERFGLGSNSNDGE